MKIKDIIVESSNMASAEQIWDYVGGIHPKDQQGGGFLKRLIMRNPQYELKRVPLSSLHVPNDEDDGNDPYGRAMFVDVDHAREYSQHHVDKKPVVADAEGHILDGAHRAWAAAELLNRTDIMAWVPAKKLTEGQSVKQEIKDFIDSLTPADVGVEEFPGYRVHFEGFTDDCKLSSDYQRNPNKVYQQVYQDFVQREGGKKPAKSGMTGDEEYPILYSVFRVPQSKTVDTAERAYSIAYRKKQPWPRGSREEQLIRSDWQLSGLYDQYVLKQGVTESNLNEAPAGGYRLVRVVDGLDNIQANGDGSLTAIARYNGHSQRNTLHFTVNSMVGDHNMGKFPGKYVIIANPAEMPRDQAAGARAEDTWYRFNNEGEINLGRAIVLAPEGSSVPNGIKAEYYKGDRSTAIDTAFKQMNVGFHGVAGTDAVIGIKNDEYHKDFSTQYGTGATQGGQHDGSLEGYLESIPARLQGYLGHLQKSIYYAPPGERETFVTSYANEIISIYRDQITKWAMANPQEFRVSATYFNYIIQIMDAYQAIFTRAEQAYNQQYQDYRAAEKQWKASNRPPAPGQPPPLDPAPPPKMATWPPQGLDLSVPNIQLSYAKKNPQGVAESENNDTAISLSKLGKFHPGADSLAEFVPERATARYALHPDKWESTFYSLTNKDSDKLKYYGPKKISIPPGTLVGDMAIANKFYRAKTPEEKQQYAELYKASLQPYPVDVSAYRMPELLIPRQGMAEKQLDELFQPGKQNWTWKIKADNEAIAKFTVGDRDYVWQAFSHFRDDKPHKWEIQFRVVKQSTDPEKLQVYGTTGTGNSAEVMSNAVDIMREFLQYYGDGVQQIAFDAKENSRIALYRKMIQRLLPNWNADEDYSSEYGLRFTLTRPKSIAEGKEQFNYELAQKGFHFEQEINGVTYRVSNKKGGSDNINIEALDDKGQSIGFARFWMHQYKDGLESLSTQVRDDWQGKGIAANMYAVMRMLGVNIHPASTQSDDGKKMWDKWNKQGDAQHIKSMNAKMTEQGVAEDAQLPGDFKLMGQNLFLKNLARNLKQRYPDATVKLSSDRVTAYHNEGDDEALSVMGTEVMDSGYIGVGLDDAFTESFQGVLVPTIRQTTEQLLAANPGTRPALFLSTDNWNPDAWTHIATKLGYRLVADDESLDENFADGRNPGRKGLAKRSGVNTKASVSSLRKTAKNSSGEKQRMAHWLANMKAGRAKARRK